MPSEPSVPAGGTPSFEERILQLRDELAQALRWDRPSLLLAVYRSEIVREQVEARLMNGLDAVPHPYFVDRTNFDIPLEVRGDPKRASTIYLVRGLRWGGGRGYSNAYRALNMHREFLVEDRVRALFWLTPLEARQLPRRAPDFWAFRHRMVEFPDLPEKAARAVQRLQEKLATQPHSPEILIALAKEYLQQQCHEEAIQAIRQAARLQGRVEQSWIPVAQIYKTMQRPEQAERLLRKAARIEKS